MYSAVDRAANRLVSRCAEPRGSDQRRDASVAAELGAGAMFTPKVRERLARYTGNMFPLQ